jgi:hypothetical protein
MYLFNNLLVFYFSYALIFFSIVGNGFFVSKFINYNDDNIFINFFLALPFLLLLGFSSYYLIGVSIIFNIVILICGLFFFFKNINLDKNFFYLIVFLLLLYPGLIISKSHDDFTLYHFQYFKELVNFPIKIGIGNLDIRYSYSSMFTFIQTLFFFPYFEFNFFHIPSFLIFTSLVGYLFTTFELKNKISLNFLKALLSIFILVKFSRLSEFGYDFIGQFLLILIFFIIINKKKEDIFIIIYLSIFAFAIKANNLIFLFILIILLNKKNIIFFFSSLKKNYLILFMSIFLLVSILLNSFLNTGCLLYFFPKSCFEDSLIFWRINPLDLMTFFDNVELWTKGYHRRIIGLELTPENYSSNFNWVKNWILIHFFYKINEFLIILFLLFLLFIFFFVKIKNFFFTYNKKFFFIFFLSLVTLFFWFIKVPQFRFGFAYILIFCMTFFLLFFRLKTVSNKRNFFILFFVALFLFNIFNIQRIISHLKSDSNYRFENFPWINILPRTVSVEVFTKKGFKYYKPEKLEEGFCFNSKTPCSLNNIEITNYKNYRIFKKI